MTEPEQDAGSQRDAHESGEGADTSHEPRSHHESPRNVAGSNDTGPRCDLCNAPMLDRHCKLVCVQCGYQRDCSDP